MGVGMRVVSPNRPLRKCVALSRVLGLLDDRIVEVFSEKGKSSKLDLTCLPYSVH
jgi:hypothetical protein